MLKRHKAVRSQRRWSYLVGIIILAVATLACALMGPGSRLGTQTVVMRNRLPTLTRTPLPTLTPTTLPAPAAVAVSTEPAAAAGAISPTLPAETSLAEPVFSEDASSSEPAVASIPPTPAALSINATHTPASLPTAIIITAPPSTSTPTATATEAPTLTPTSTPTPTTTPLPEGWVFAGVRDSADEEQGNLLLYGEVVNNTGAAQKLVGIAATVHDEQGQLIPTQHTFIYTPIETIPQGGWVPFELTIVGLKNAANFELQAQPKPSNESPHQDFEFSNLHPSNQAGDYCITGHVRNLGVPLQFYLTIAAVLYDSQDQVINFGFDYQNSPTNLVGDQTIPFVICVNPLDQEVARHELRAWGL